MILVDTSVWVDHFRRHDPVLAALLERGQVVCHPFVLGELATGSLPRRAETLQSLGNLPSVILARDHEVLAFIEQQRLFGAGLGYIDLYLLASVRLTAGTSLWTRDERLLAVTETLSLAARLQH